MDFRKAAWRSLFAIVIVAGISTVPAAPPNQRRAADIVGTEVFEAGGRSMGVVRQVLIDTQDQEVVYVLAGKDAPLEDGDRAVRVRAGELRPAYRDDRFVLLLPPGDMARLETFEVRR